MENDVNDQDLHFLAKLNAHPLIKSRMKEILKIAENTSGVLTNANDAEEQTRQEVQKLGQDVLQEWAMTMHERACKELQEKEPKTSKTVKKNSIGEQHSEK